ncbi:MAG: hypothetical protein HKN48_05860 [Flavobacteriaceae bacterium]|nr:hypothetical protein [Flavobacteriaceae bacterium]
MMKKYPEGSRPSDLKAPPNRTTDEIISSMKSINDQTLFKVIIDVSSMK